MTMKMHVFEYQAMRDYGEEVRGSIKAETTQDARVVLRRYGLRFCKIWEKRADSLA